VGDFYWVAAWRRERPFQELFFFVPWYQTRLAGLVVFEELFIVKE
jgi:hypothetical protein